jgi:hypothetical protein
MNISKRILRKNKLRSISHLTLQNNLYFPNRFFDKYCTWYKNSVYLKGPIDFLMSHVPSHVSRMRNALRAHLH